MGKLSISQLYHFFSVLQKTTFVLRHLRLIVNYRLCEVLIVEVLYHLLELKIGFSEEA